MSQVPLLKVTDLHTYYGGSHVLHGVSLAVEQGEVVAVLGRNGVGKSTLLQSILGLPKPRSGEVRLNGMAMAGKPIYEIVRAGIGWVPQGHRIFPTLTVLENLELAASRSRPGSWTLERMFDLFPRLKERRMARGGSLSGGEQQMLAIARTLVQNPSVILMDEPSEGLSPRLVDEVHDIVAHLDEKGHSVLLVEQNMAFALSAASRVLVMSKGEIVFSGRSSELTGNSGVLESYLGVSASPADKKEAKAK